jgi:hypothetical protein
MNTRLWPPLVKEPTSDRTPPMSLRYATPQIEPVIAV